MNLGDSLIDDTSVMFREPILEERVRHSHPDSPRWLVDISGWLEPGVETVPVHLCFNAREDLVPEVHLGREDAKVGQISVKFPQFFPQVWKTLGRDQIAIGDLLDVVGEASTLKKDGL